MTGGDQDSAYKLAPPHFEGHVRRRIRPIHHQNPKTIRGENFRGNPGEGLRLESHVETDEDSPLFAFDGLEIVGRSLRRNSDVLECKCVGDYPAPAVGSKLNRIFHSDEKSVTTVLSPSTTPGRSLAERPM